MQGLKLGVCAFLNLTRDHLDYHKTMESYFNEKRKSLMEKMAKLQMWLLSMAIALMVKD